MENEFLIPLNGLTPGRTTFGWSVGKEFFNGFGNEEVLDAELTVRADVEKAGSYLGIDLQMDGYITVACDRCLADLKIPVHPTAALSVKYEGSENSDGGADGEREVISIPADNTELDLGQIIYDYSCLALPLQRVHEEGECDPSVAGRLGKDKAGSEEAVQDSPFASLKGIFENK